ncbi:MAG: fluoride efflux transporter CrcB [Actinomycetales bacterium]|nr:fluoride efflux transporter CrcB [Actinomycetales bacterium]
MTVLLVALGAAVGAPLRYLVDHLVQTRHDEPFPWGTFVVNVSGCLLLGVLAGLPISPEVSALGITGFCGALTTYSTFGHETVHLARDGVPAHAVANVLLHLGAGFGAGYLGLLLARVVTG